MSLIEGPPGGESQPSLFDRGVKLRLLNDVPLPAVCPTPIGPVSDKVMRAVLRAVDDKTGRNSSWTIPLALLIRHTSFKEAAVRRAIAALKSDAVAAALFETGTVGKAAIVEAVGEGWALLSVTAQYKSPKGRSASEYQILWPMLKVLANATAKGGATKSKPAAARPPVALTEAVGSAHGERSLPAHSSRPVSNAHQAPMVDGAQDGCSNEPGRDELNIDPSDMANSRAVDRLFDRYARSSKTELQDCDADRFQFHALVCYVARQVRESKVAQPYAFLRWLLTSDDPKADWRSRIAACDEDRARFLSVRRKELL